MAKSPYKNPEKRRFSDVSKLKIRDAGNQNHYYVSDKSQIGLPMEAFGSLTAL
jgi:hypothetical protein